MSVVASVVRLGWMLLNAAVLTEVFSGQWSQQSLTLASSELLTVSVTTLLLPAGVQLLYSNSFLILFNWKHCSVHDCLCSHCIFQRGTACIVSFKGVLSLMYILWGTTCIVSFKGVGATCIVSFKGALPTLYLSKGYCLYLYLSNTHPSFRVLQPWPSDLQQWVTLQHIHHKVKLCS